MTQAQAELLIRLLSKYRRQLKELDIDVTPMIDDPKYRIPPIAVNRHYLLYLDQGYIKLAFPFVPTLIEQVREFAKESQGSCKWDQADRVWNIDVTDYNIMWSYEWAQHHGYEISDEMTEIYKGVIEHTDKVYDIVLEDSDGQMRVARASANLDKWMQEHLDLSNRLQLIDHSGILGYSISEEMHNEIKDTYGNTVCRLLTSRQVRLNPLGEITEDDVRDLLQYAELTDRWPMVVYEPDLKNQILDILMKLLDPSDIFVASSKNPSVDMLSHKIIHVIRPLHPDNISGKIPLLVSSSGMMFGAPKQHMLQIAEKVVYLSADVYNKKQGRQ